ncbi:MAG: beta-L-arabinofuranosidase domain-containing protein [Planctomycetota bacterium]
MQDSTTIHRSRKVAKWILCTLFICGISANTFAQSDYPLKPVPYYEVEMTSDFWRPRMVTQRKTLVPWAFERTTSGVEHLQAAADVLAGKAVEDHRPHRFIDSDLYKVMEGAAYLIQLERDPGLEAKMDAIIDVIASAQEPDGYLYPSHTTGVGKERDMMGDTPYSFVVHSHELYNMGHLYEAAVAYYETTGKDKLLKIAEKNAQHVNRVFFEGEAKYNAGKPVNQAPGHQEPELALVKLYRVTGKQLYLDMARKFLEIRGISYVPDGEGVMAPTYAQQHEPVKEQSEAVGHAVRATYLYAAMADVGTLTGDTNYAKALNRIWENITNTKMHITGGLGAVHGIEGFGPKYELPNADAFNETCAAVGNVFFNYRMFLLTKDAKFLDVAEVALLNNVLAAVNLEGNRFFYVNPLDADGKYPFNHGTASRAPWFGTACCPSNIARLIPQVPGMTYAHDKDNVFVTFYAESKTRLEVANTNVEIAQSTTYPNAGEVTIQINPEKESQFSLHLRIPTWAQGQRFVPGELYEFVDASSETISLKVNGEAIEASKLHNGFAVIDRTWKSGDRVELSLPMPVRVSRSHAQVEANRDRVAFTRGPFVMCAEGIDNGGVTQRFFLPDTAGKSNATIAQVETEHGNFIQATVAAEQLTASGDSKTGSLVLTPYYAWNNRDTGSMTVWFPTKPKLAVYDPHALPQASVFSELSASYTSELDTVSAIGDRLEPEWSSGNKVPRWTSRGQEGKGQWIVGRFQEPKTIRSVGVFWMDDWRGTTKFPENWSLEVEQDGKWVQFQLYTTDKYDTRANQYNVVHPAAPTKCEAIRINVKPLEKMAVGILEVQVQFED